MRLPLIKTAGLRAADPADIVWRKARRSHDTGACVEVALVGGKRLVRDSKASDAGVLEFDADGWRSFVDQIERYGVDR